MFLRVANLEICTVYYGKRSTSALAQNVFRSLRPIYGTTFARRLRFGLANLNNNDFIFGLWLARVKNQNRPDVFHPVKILARHFKCFRAFGLNIEGAKRASRCIYVQNACLSKKVTSKNCLLSTTLPLRDIFFNSYWGPLRFCLLNH